MSGRLVTAVVAAFIVLGLSTAALAQPQPDPSKQCKKGRTVGSGDSSADQNGNGYVCVNQQTGEVTDDKEQFEPEGQYGLDENGNNFLCYNPEANVVTDDDHTQPPEGLPSSCPPGFFHVLAFLFQ